MFIFYLEPAVEYLAFLHNDILFLIPLHLISVVLYMYYIFLNFLWINKFILLSDIVQNYTLRNKNKPMGATLTLASNVGPWQHFFASL